MVDPVPVTDDTKQNAPNRRVFFDDIKSHENRLDKIERGSIRSGSVGGAGLRFYDPEQTYPDNGNFVTTAIIGQFDGYWFEYDETDGTGEWKDVEGARGIALYEASELIKYPWFVAAADGSKQWVQVGYGGTVPETVIVRAKNISLHSEDGDSAVMVDTNGNIVIYPTSAGDLMLYNIDSVGAGDNLVFDFSGGTPKVKYVSSARKYKQDIEDAEINPEDVLQMRPRTWRDRNEVAENPDTERRFIGFIADELADITSLQQFVRFNEDNEPESIYYDRLTVALLELLKQQQTKIDAHEEELQNINEKFDQLKNMVESIT